MLFERIKELLREHGKTKRDLSEALGIGINTIKRWETEGRTPNAVTLAGIANYFGVSVDYLLGKTEEKHNTGDVLELNDRERSMLEAFRAIPEEQQDKLIDIFESLLKSAQGE